MPAEEPMDVYYDNERQAWVFDHYETKNGSKFRHILACVDEASARSDYNSGACYSCP